MVPTLLSGDYVLVKNRRGSIENGAIVLIFHPYLGHIVKRVMSKDELGRYFIKGDSLESTTTLDLGPIQSCKINAIVHWRISKQGLSNLHVSFPVDSS